MFGLIKIAGLSAVLSAGLVTAFDLPGAPERAPIAGQKFLDRLPQDGREVAAHRTATTTGSVTLAREAAAGGKAAVGRGNFQRSAAADCTGQTWPNISHDCLTSADGRPARQAARMITVEERRDMERTSVLVRLPATEIARR